MGHVTWLSLLGLPPRYPIIHQVFATYFSNISIRIENVPFKKMHAKVSAKWWSFRVGFNVIIRVWWRHRMETFFALLALCVWNSPAPVNSPHKGQWRGALMFSLICAWINGLENNREAGDLRRHHAHYDVIVMHPGTLSSLCNLIQ